MTIRPAQAVLVIRFLVTKNDKITSEREARVSIYEADFDKKSLPELIEEARLELEKSLSE